MDELQIYPNPSNGQFILAFPHLDNEELTIIVTNMMGQEVYSKPGSLNNGEGEMQLDLSQYPNGVYQLKIISDHFIAVRPVIIQ